MVPAPRFAMAALAAMTAVGDSFRIVKKPVAGRVASDAEEELRVTQKEEMGGKAGPSDEEEEELRLDQEEMGGKAGNACGRHNNLLDCVNSYRRVKLRSNGKLNRAATEFTSAFKIVNGRWPDSSHTNPKGQNDGDLIEKYYGPGSAIGCGYAKKDWRLCVDAWKESSFHWRVLVADKFTDFGWGGSEAATSAFFGPGYAP